MVGFDLFAYLSKEIEKLIADVLKSTLKNPKESAFFLQYKKENDRNERTRKSYEDKGVHVPPFLIASIAQSCNLSCKGCYARANGLCSNDALEQLDALSWRGIFRQASELGVSFVLLAGGEPLLRHDVIREAASFPGILFPIFTNGTVIDDECLELFDKHRNLIPILSIEGDAKRTDERRGLGTFAKVQNAMQRLSARGILFGCSLTITSENMRELTSKRFIESLIAYGCRLAFYISFVPVEKGTEYLAPTDEQNVLIEQTLLWLRSLFPQMILLSFPGDEKLAGGCLAAGRGFFHINANGAVEACPFSPYGDRDLKTHTMLEALQSPFFQRLRESGLVGGKHDGGCTLFVYEDEVKGMLEKNE